MQVTQRGTVFSDNNPASPTRVACYPGLARLSDGRILCVFSVGSSKSSVDSSLRIAQSSDEGGSWHLTSFEPSTTLNSVPGCIYVGSVVETRPGHLLLMAYWVNRSNPELPVSHPETAGCLEMRLLAFRSQDGGATWSTPEDITHCAPFEQPEISGPLIALQENGHFLQPMENQKFYNDPNPIDEKAYALISRDYGQTWNEWAMIVHDHPARKYWCNRVAKLPSGKLVAVSWAFDNIAERDLPLHLIHGSPDGREWSTPVSTGIEGQVSYLLPLDESTLLMSTSHRESPAGIRLRTSNDGGMSWDGDGLLVLDAENQASRSGGDMADYYNAMTDYTFGWSPMVTLSDNRVLLVYFTGFEEHIEIQYAQISL